MNIESGGQSVKRPEEAVGLDQHSSLEVSPDLGIGIVHSTYEAYGSPPAGGCWPYPPG